MLSASLARWEVDQLANNSPTCHYNAPTCDKTHCLKLNHTKFSKVTYLEICPYFHFIAHYNRQSTTNNKLDYLYVTTTLANSDWN